MREKNINMSNSVAMFAEKNIDKEKGYLLTLKNSERINFTILLEFESLWSTHHPQKSIMK